MLDFKPTEDILSLSEFRNTLADCVARTAETHRPIILTQNGRATSVFLSAADWEKINQKIYDAETYEDILVSEGESERGEVYTSEEVKRIIEADLKKLTSRYPAYAVAFSNDVIGTADSLHSRPLDEPA